MSPWTAREGQRVAFPLILANILIPIAIITFATGFFPYKPFLPGLAQYDGPGAPAAPFDRLILMVVDALRSDFVYLADTGFEFTRQLIKDGDAVPFTANARSPTITMPRIKAITTGSIPSFLDVILNFDEGDTTSSLASQDTWLAQMRAKGSGKLIMFGDDTWLKLFPGTFHRHDGTSSFFVSDFTEVDNNVTRNIAAELLNDDWNTMILHYLGLDHIGHKSGPRSPNMVPKQREMDGIVKQLYDAMQTDRHLSSTLLVLCGDHGMNDAGNHGASSPGETSPALVFISPKLKSVAPRPQSPPKPRDDFRYYSFVEQSDLAPTLAALLGFPVPKNNVGAFIADFLPLWPKKTDQVKILMQNARQVLGIATAAFGDEFFRARPTLDQCIGSGSQIQNIACRWHKIKDDVARLGLEDEQQQSDLPAVWLQEVFGWLREAQDFISGMASNYNIARLGLGMSLSLAASLLATYCVFSAGIGLAPLAPLAAMTAAYGAMMFASSYVEEEHHFWYWATSAWIASLVVTRTTGDAPTHALLRRTMFPVAMAATRLVRGWNQTGQKFAGSPDIVKTFIGTNPSLLWLLVFLTYGITVQAGMRRSLGGIPAVGMRLLSSVIVVLALWFKMAFTREDAPELTTGLVERTTRLLAVFGVPLVALARRVFAAVGIVAAYATYLGLRGGNQATGVSNCLHHLYTTVALTQSRAANIPLFLLYHLQFRALQSVHLSVPDITTSALLLQHMSFFAFGGTNAISSVDLSSAYNGVNGFNVVAVGVLTFVSNWAGPIYWTSAATLLLVRKRAAGEKLVFARHATMLTFFVTWAVFFVMAACTALRTHLFIWTVFSPKYLYCMAWALGQHLVANLALGGLLYVIGTRS
jgi:ethanolamine phosphate transferase 2 subunit G